MLEALSELEDCYSFGPSAGAQGLALTKRPQFPALSPGETPIDLDIPSENLGQHLTSAGPPAGCLCPRAETVALRTLMPRTGHHVDVSLAY